MGLLFNKPDDVAGSALPAILIGAFVAFGGVLFGYDTGTIGGILAMPYWDSKIPAKAFCGSVVANVCNSTFFNRVPRP